ncbi:DUF726 domain-containing protein [Corynebacterium variabile]|uniref:DUF726 domain-containing protein n=2 Tax=Corynebacterium variabile TaxID=1727 RepID=UPI0028ACFAE6|nr:DUF726 domain-containing protein [Corynebacterium variabile]
MHPFDDVITFTAPDDSGHFACEIWSPKGRSLKVFGNLHDPEPTVTGDAELTRNRAIAQNLWTAASEYVQGLAIEEAESEDDAASAELVKSYETAARASAKTAKKITGYTENLGEETTEGWCSNCAQRTTHHKVIREGRKRSLYLCDSCGAPTVNCAAPGCTSMAVKTGGTKGMVPYCAEHRHDIPSFERSAETITDLTEWETLVQFDKPDLAKLTTRASIGVAAVSGAAGVAMLAAPAVGGIIGAQILGHTGIVATNAGLAALGGGSVAAGGLGMAGGTYVVATAGGLLGGVYGDRILGSYIGADKSFRIEKIGDGAGVPVVIARGFLNEKNPEWYKAVRAVKKLYPDSPVYELNWGSKELKHLGAVVGTQAVGQVGKKALLKTVGRAGKVMAKKAAPIAPTLAAGSLLKNPWHTAVNRANQTGTALAALLAKTEQKEFVLVGHSLGGRVMVTAATAMAGFGAAPKIRDIHLMGAAIGGKRNWRPLSEAVNGTVNNYHSAKDPVLKYLYSTAQFGQSAVGRVGFHSQYPNIVDHNVSEIVSNHGEYYDNVELVD